MMNPLFITLFPVFVSLVNTVDVKHSSRHDMRILLSHNYKYANYAKRLFLARYPIRDHETIQLLLDQHNHYRRSIPTTYMHELVWDAKLAETAQLYAEQCIWQHSGYVKYFELGECLWSSGKYARREAVQMWYDEIYNRTCDCTNFYKKCCGHFTQVMHADTRRIGCGLAECSGLVHLTSERRYILACHYSPPGNKIYVNANYAVPAFEYATARHPVCSKCPPGTLCANKLCRSL